jgi:hypothetical protein
VLVPLVSWAAPASVPESYLLKPSLEYCFKRLAFHPDIVVGDMGYIHQETKRHFRTRWNLAIVTKMKADMLAHCEYSPAAALCCPQGQALAWMDYDPEDQSHWFEPAGSIRLCPWCWQQSSCPKQFSYPASTHETFFGSIPLNTLTARKLLYSVRTWIEPAQSFEKNQLGLKRLFVNSLSFCWAACLLADSAVLIRTLAILAQPKSAEPLADLRPRQAHFDFD